MLDTLIALDSKLSVVTSRLQIMELKGEASTLQIFRQLDKLSAEVVSIKNDIKSLKARQDMLFVKQDIMQSTLAGETPPVSRSCTLSGGPSIVAWSPVPNSPPFGIPYTQSLLSQHTRYQHPQYSAPKNSLDELSACLSNEEIQSLLGEDLDTHSGITHSAKNQNVDSTGNPVPPVPSSNLAGIPPPLQKSFLIPDPVGIPLPPSKSYVAAVDLPEPSQSDQTRQSGYPLPPSDSSMRAGNLLPLSLLHLLDLTETRCMSTSTGCGISELALHGTPSQEGVCPNTLGKGMTSSRSLLSCRSADDSFFAQTFHSDNLIQANIVLDFFEARLKNRSLDIRNVGRLGVLLARCVFFGDDVMQGSTLKGKGNRPGLDPHKLEALMSVIHERPAFRNMSKEEFAANVQPRIERSLRDSLKPSSKKT